MQHNSWNPFGNIDEQIRQAQDEASFDLNELNKDFARIFKTPSGKRVMEYLKSITLNQSVFMPHLGMENGVAMGFFREGQNVLVRDMLMRIEKGLKANKQEA